MAEMLDEVRRRFSEIDVYPVTGGPELSAGRGAVEVLEGLLAGGAKIVQLREKSASFREIYATAQIFRDRTRAHDALLIINDHIDIAMAVGADGVHLGQDDLPLPAARRIAPNLLIGVSTHSADQAVAAQAAGADYVNIGPLFPTQTKSTPHAPLGLAVVERVGPMLSIPFTVMGGIKLAHIPALVAAGATRIAVVTALTAAADIVTATREFRTAILDAKKSSPAPTTPS